MAKSKSIKEKVSGRDLRKILQKPSLKDKIETWCASSRKLIVGLIILVSVVFRAGYFLQINNTYLINRHLWEESDMSFFNRWATIIAEGNVLSDTLLHPIHGWTVRFAAQYFTDHPDVYKTLRGRADYDSLRNPPSKMLWDQWYGGKRFHQEPLYAYFIAMTYKLAGHDVRIVFFWQMVLGVITNLLIYLVARRYFGDFNATLSAVMAVFCGPMIFYELVLLRSSMTVFFSILLVYLYGIARDRNKPGWWAVTGAVSGLAIVLQVYYILFLFGGIILLITRFRNEFRKVLVYTGCLVAGTLLTLSPVIVRNAVVGVPLFALNSNGASTFIADNNGTVRNFSGWDVDVKIESDIMGSSGGQLLKAIIPTLQTNRDLMGYLAQLLEKAHATCSWYEIPNNVNFYFFREHSVVLSIAFFNFLLLAPLALTGLIFAVTRKRKADLLYLMILVQLVPLLGFLVLSRHRVALIPVLIPFAALALTELSASWKGGKNPILATMIVILIAWSASPHNKYTITMMKVDYDSIYNLHYVKPLKTLTDHHEWKEADILLQDFIDRYEPRTLKKIKPFFKCTRDKEAELYLFFSWIHSIHSQILIPTGDTKSATSEHMLSDRLKDAARINQ